MFDGSGLKNGDKLPNAVGNEYDRVMPESPTPANIQVLTHSPVTCRDKKSFADCHLLHPLERRRSVRGRDLLVDTATQERVPQRSDDEHRHTKYGHTKSTVRSRKSWRTSSATSRSVRRRSASFGEQPGAVRDQARLHRKDRTARPGQPERITQHDAASRRARPRRPPPVRPPALPGRPQPRRRHVDDRRRPLRPP